MSAIVSVYATFVDTEEAERIGRAMVERGLAACVNILGPCRSIYRWQGTIEDASEVAAIFKTAEHIAAELIDGIASLHSYDVPAVVAWPVAEALSGYAEWVVAETRVTT